MLSNLHVKNLALIEECDINLTPGLNILSGETGAGKSILIGSMNLALGAKADKDMIRHGAEYGLVELVFENLDQEVYRILEEMDFSTEEDIVILQRKITPTKSVFKINGETATARQVKHLAEALIDIHGQHEHQSLLKNAKHMEILDTFGGTELTDTLHVYMDAYKEFHSLKEAFENINLDDDKRQRELDLLQYEIQEIEAASLKSGEDEELELLYRKMSHAKQINEALQKCLSCTDSDGGAGAWTTRAVRELRPVLDFDSDLEKLHTLLEDIDGLISDFNRQASRIAENMEFSEQEYFDTENRLNTINHLKDKYGYTMEAVLESLQEKQKRADELVNFEVYLQQMEEKVQKAYAVMQENGYKLSELRRNAAHTLSKILTKALLELNFLDVRFEIALNSKTEAGPKGLEDIEFMISTNPGEPLKPMIQVASGGELSRIMLAIKTVLAQRDAIDTLIFDEIDSGISGKTAWRVSEKLGELSRTHQIICITHLPQIAAMADTHFLISKTVADGNTVSGIDILKEEESILELARMAGADVIIESGTEHAKNMRMQANHYKNTI